MSDMSHYAIMYVNIRCVGLYSTTENIHMRLTCYRIIVINYAIERYFLYIIFCALQVHLIFITNVDVQQMSTAQRQATKIPMTNAQDKK